MLDAHIPPRSGSSCGYLHMKIAEIIYLHMEIIISQCSRIHTAYAPSVQSTPASSMA